MSTIILFAICIVLLLMFINPKLGTYIIWPILFMYPHGWLAEHPILPLNIGIDDLFCITLFLTVFIRKNLLGSMPIRFGYAFWTITGFAIVLIIANLAGYRAIESAELRTGCIKDVLKMGIYWGLFYSILHCIDNVRDLKIQLAVFSIAVVAGGMIVIMQYFFPYRMDIFTAPDAIAAMSDETTRTSGAFLNANSAGCMMGCSLMLVIASVRLQKNILFKLIVYSFLFVLLAGLLLTKSRSSLFALCATISLMGIFGRSKKMAWIVLFSGMIVLIALPTFRDAFLERIQRTSDIREDSSVKGRQETWEDYLHSMTPKTFVFGQGMTRGRELNNQESHSAYVSLIAVYGIGGVIWALVAIIVFFRKALSLKRFSDPLVSVVSTGCIWALIFWGFYGMAADAINTPHPRYLLFYIVVLMSQASVIAKQELISLSYYEQYNELYDEQYCEQHDEQMDYIQMQEAEI